MNPRTVVLDYWRNYMPAVPNEIEFSCRQAQPALLDLSQYLVQGARDFDTNLSPSPDVLDKVDVQRGWRCRPLLLNQPDTAMVRTVQNGFEIECMESGEQCFNFRLTNGTQMSDVVKVLLNVEEWYSVSAKIAVADTDKYVFTAVPEFPSALRQPFAYTLHWYWDHKIEVTDPTVKTTRVVDTTTVMQESTVIDQYRQFLPAIVKRPVLTAVLPTDAKLSGLDGKSSRIYQPTGTRGTIRCVCRLYLDSRQSFENTYLDLSKYTEVEYTTPEKWWERGDIQPV